MVNLIARTHSAPVPGVPSVDPGFHLPHRRRNAPHPARHPKSRKIPPHNDASMLDFTELIRHTISNQVKNPVLPQSQRSATAIRRH